MRQRWSALDAVADDPSVDYDAEADALTDAGRAISSAAAVIPAVTFAGLAVKARILACATDCPADDDPGIMTWAREIAGAPCRLDRAVGSLVADLLRLAQEDGR